MRESHVQATQEQMSHEHFAGTNRANFASENGGRPAMAAVSHPMTNSNMVAHAAYNNNSRPAYNANNGNRPAYGNSNNTYKAAANNQPKYNNQQNPTRRRIRTSASRIMNPIPTGAGSMNGGHCSEQKRRPAVLLRAVLFGGF